METFLGAGRQQIFRLFLRVNPQISALNTLIKEVIVPIIIDHFNAQNKSTQIHSKISIKLIIIL